jgi:hypothetical protein
VLIIPGSMEGFVNQFNAINIAAIGDGAFPPAQKLADLQAIRRIDFNNLLAPINFRALLQTDWDNIDHFNNALINVQNLLTGFYDQGEHGILNCGAKYASFLAVRTAGRNLVLGIQNNANLNANQRLILIYCLLPIFYMPPYDQANNPDKAKGEKTFGKMILNLAVMNSKCRIEFVQGYWEHYQITHYNN